MLRALRYISVLIFVLSAIWILNTSSSFHACIDKQTAAEREQAKENPPPFVLSLTNNAAICVRCAGHVIFEYRDAATAVATVLIAFFTFTLKRSTDELRRVVKGEIADLAPGQQTFSQFGIPFNQWEDMKANLNAKTWTFYVFGRIDYVDVFNELRWTEYRYELRVDSRGILDETSLVIDGQAGNRTS